MQYEGSWSQVSTVSSLGTIKTRGYRKPSSSRNSEVCLPERLFFFAREEERSRRTPYSYPKDRAESTPVKLFATIGMFRLFGLPQAEAYLRSTRHCRRAGRGNIRSNNGGELVSFAHLDERGRPSPRGLIRLTMGRPRHVPAAASLLRSSPRRLHSESDDGW
jgi:hypothetical protein